MGGEDKKQDFAESRFHTHLLGLEVQLEDLIPPLSVWLWHPNLAVKAPRTHKGRIQQVRPVGW